MRLVRLDHYIDADPDPLNQNHSGVDSVGNPYGVSDRNLRDITRLLHHSLLSLSNAWPDA